MRPTFDNRQTLSEITDLPVLGSVSMVWTKGQVSMRQRRHIAFLFGLLALVSAYGVVMFVHLSDVSIKGYINRALELAGL